MGSLLSASIPMFPCPRKPSGQVPCRHVAKQKTRRGFFDLMINKGSKQLLEGLEPMPKGDVIKKLLEELKPIRKGDMVNLHDLLFTKNRDYLVKYNDDQQVKAVRLAGKVIVLNFLRLDLCPLIQGYISPLIEAYTYLLPDNVFEVVLIAYETEEDIFSISSDSLMSSGDKFEALFSRMPWTAIPYSDISSRERLLSKFGIDRRGGVYDLICH